MNENLNHIVANINATLAAQSLWDGFWIHSFKTNTLIISCSFDKMYYRSFDLVFKKVTFFNLPDAWRDTNVAGDTFLRLATKEEFMKQQPIVDIGDNQLFAVDLIIDTKKQSFFIAAKHVFLNECTPLNNNPVAEYTDPYKGEKMPVLKNRVIKK